MVSPSIGWEARAQRTDVIETGRPGSEGLTFTITDDANISPAAPHAMVISFCAPRLELKLGLLGAYGGSTFLKVASAAIDLAMDAIEKKLLPAGAYTALKASNAGNVTASNIVGSSADVYIQVIHTEGVTHSSNVTLAPCTKIELKVMARSGGEANLFGRTKDAETTKEVFTGTFKRWDPGSNFCKSI